MYDGRRTHRIEAVILSLILLSALGCSRSMMGLFFDLPPREEGAPTAATEARPTRAGPSSFLFPVDTGPPPPIEGTLDPDSVVKLLPRDHAGNIDWVAALDSGIIEPQSHLPGEPPKELPAGFDFKFDFYLPGPAPTFDASFPHSSHTEWIDCNQCHSRIFRYQDTEFAMADVLNGEYCGECHGKVAFPSMTGCERCHTALPQPPDRAKPELIGTIEMQRVSAGDGAAADSAAEGAPAGDSASAAPDSTSASADSAATGEGAAPDSATAVARMLGPEGNAAGVDVSSFPRARFPHWVHRIRHKCKACHMDVFVPEAGANAVTMQQIDRGEKCGVCHDGETAFLPDFGSCERCHVPPERPAAQPADGGG